MADIFDLKDDRHRAGHAEDFASGRLRLGFALIGGFSFQMTRDATSDQNSASLWLEQARQVLSQPTKKVSDYNKQRFTVNCSKWWNLFYKHNTTQFFKDRHWTLHEFAHEIPIFEPRSLDSPPQKCDDEFILLEVGCGVGNFFLPLTQIARENGHAFRVFACDFSPRAIDLIHQSMHYDSGTMSAFVCDITQPQCFTQACESIRPGSVNVTSMIFVLSAILPERMPQVIKNVHDMLKPGGSVIFRDYARFDLAQVRFHQQSDPKAVDENLYLRHDGTLSYFFDKQELVEIFGQAGLECQSIDYIYRRLENRKEQKVMNRIFVQGVFRKPTGENDAKMSDELSSTMEGLLMTQQ